MKKLLLPLIALMLSVSAISAQTRFGLNAQKAPMGALQRSDAPANVPGKARKAAPAKITLADNQKIMGPYTTDELAGAGYGMGLSYNATLSAAAYMENMNDFAIFDGGKVVSMRYGLSEAATVNKVFIKGIKGNSIVDLCEAPVTATPVVGWNDVTFETPYTLDLTGIEALLMGFEYVSVNGKYPLSFAGPETITFVYGNLGQGTGWYNLGSTGASLSIQAIVEKDYPDYWLKLTDSYCLDYVKAGEELEYDFSFRNEGKAPLSNYSFGVAIDGTEIAEVQNPSENLTETEAEYTGTLPTSGLANGAHVFSVYIKTVNGEAVEAAESQKQDYEFGVYTESYPRQKQLVEHFTSTYCTWCPRGVTFLEQLSSKRDDIAWVSLHGNMSSGTDIYTISAGSEIMSYMTNGFPSAAFNRYPLEDGQPAMGIGYDPAYAAQYADMISDVLDMANSMIPSFATVDLSADFNDEAGTIDIKVSGETVADFKALMGEDAALTVYITEDSLVSKQLNAGRWVTAYTHNNVLRAVATAPLGDALNMTGNTYENNYSVKLNTAWKKKDMHVTAFIARALSQKNYYDEKLWVTNTETVKMKESTTGISTAITSAENRPVEFYTVDGVRIDSPVKGLNIVKLSNGETRKVMVK